MSQKMIELVSDTYQCLIS